MPMTVSWSVRAITRTPSSVARSGTSSGSRQPSLAVECMWRSTSTGPKSTEAIPGLPPTRPSHGVTDFLAVAVGLNKCSRQPVVLEVDGMLGEREVIQLIEDNEYPARVIEIGLVWIELEITDLKTKVVRRERLSKSAFADLILDWRERRTRSVREIAPALRKIGIAA